MGYDKAVEVPPDVGEANRSRGRLVAVATVITTLAAASTGYMQAVALRDHDEADIKAERLGALAGTASAGGKEHASVQIERLRTELEADHFATAPADSAPEVAAWNEFAERITHKSAEIARRQAIPTECSWSTGSCQTTPIQPLCTQARCKSGNWYRPEHGIVGYEEKTQEVGYRLDAERVAADAEADAAESRFAHLAAALTMLSVAVFLFGYSLTPQGHERRGFFLTIASGFLFFGVGWSIYHVAQGQTHPPPAAAKAFAAGEAALNSGDASTAVRELRTSTRLWPGSSQAYSELAIAQYEAIASPKHADASSDPPALEKAIGDDERALAAGTDSPTVTTDLGEDLLFLGIDTKDDARIRRAAELGRAASTSFVRQEKQEHGAPGWYLIDASLTAAEGDLALGASDASGATCVTVRRIVDLRHQVDPSMSEAATRQYLGLIQKHRGGRTAQAENLVRQVEAAKTMTAAPRCPSYERPATSPIAPALLLH
jgi:hypothetical protein